MAPNPQNLHLAAQMPGAKKTSGKVPPMAQRARLVRETTGLNQTQFAKKLDISVSRWNNIENGTPLSIDVALRIVKKVPGVTIDWLYLGKTEGLTMAFSSQLAALEAGSTTTTASHSPRGAR